MGRLRDGVRELREAARKDPNSEEPYQALAQVFKYAGYLDREVEALEHLRALGTRDPAVYLRLASIYSNLNWMDRVGPVVRQALSVAPQSLPAQTEMAQYLFLKGDTQGAIKQAQDAVRAHPEDQHATSLCAQYLMTLNRFDEAEVMLRDYLKRQPDNRAISLLLANNFVRRPDKTRLVEAIALLNRVLKQGAPGAEPFAWLGRAYDRMGKVPEAIAAYEACYKQEPNFESVAYSLGQLYIRSGRTQEGAKLIAFHTQVDKNTTAFSNAREGVGVSPLSPEAHRKVAEWYTRLGAYPKAIVEYRRILELRPGDQAAKLALRKALIATHRNSEARQVA